MKYAKLINNYPRFAPNPILHDGDYIGNPLPDVCLARGYKPVRYTEPPGEPDEGYQWSEIWTEAETEIVQGWKQVPAPDDVSPDEAMEILFGGEN